MTSVPCARGLGHAPNQLIGQEDATVRRSPTPISGGGQRSSPSTRRVPHCRPAAGPAGVQSATTPGPAAAPGLRPRAWPAVWKRGTPPAPRSAAVAKNRADSMGGGPTPAPTRGPSRRRAARRSPRGGRPIWHPRRRERVCPSSASGRGPRRSVGRPPPHPQGWRGAPPRGANRGTSVGGGGARRTGSEWPALPPLSPRTPDRLTDRRAPTAPLAASRRPQPRRRPRRGGDTADSVTGASGRRPRRRQRAAARRRAARGPHVRAQPRAGGGTTRCTTASPPCRPPRGATVGSATDRQMRVGVRGATAWGEGGGTPHRRRGGGQPHRRRSAARADASPPSVRPRRRRRRHGAGGSARGRCRGGGTVPNPAAGRAHMEREGGTEWMGGQAANETGRTRGGGRPNALARCLPLLPAFPLTGRPAEEAGIPFR